MVRTSHEEAARRVDNNCKAHLMIDEVSFEQQYNSVKCKMSILGATDPSQIGKSTTEFFKTDGKAAGMFLNLAEAAQLITREQRRAAHEQGVGMDIDESQLKGRQICATIKMEPKLRRNPVTGQNEVDPEDPGPYSRIGFDTYGIWDQKAAGIPLDMQFASMIPKPAGWTQGPQPPAAGQPAPAQPPKPTQPTQPPQGQGNLPLEGQGNSATSMNW